MLDARDRRALAVVGVMALLATLGLLLLALALGLSWRLFFMVAGL